MKRLPALPRLAHFALYTGFILLLVMSLLRLGFYFFFSHQGYTLSHLGDVFWMGLRYDLRAVSLVMLVLLLLGSIPLLHPFRSARLSSGWRLFFGSISLLLVFFYIIDFAHYAYLAQRLNASVLGFLEDTGISANMVWQSYPVIRLLLLILAASFGLFWLIRKGHQRIADDIKPISKRNRVLATILLSLLCGGLIFGRLNQYPLRWSDAFSLGSDYKANLALNPFETFFNTLQYRGKIYDLKKVKAGYPVLAAYYGLDANAAEKLDFARSNQPDTVLPVKPNIILVICESFSAYKSSMWGNPLNTTPFFDSLSKQGVFFDQCFTPAYGTARGVWATLTGLPDVDIRQTASRNPEAVDQQMLIPQFEGYEKYYFIGGSPSWANIRGVLMNNIPGLKLYEEENLKSPRLDVWGVSDKNLFVEASEILGQSAKPFFAVIQTADNHRPYSIPKEDTDFVPDRPAESLLDQNGFRDQPNYETKLKEYNAFRYTDYTYRKFIEAARRQPYFNNTLFVFVGDHGIAGDAGKRFPAAWTDNRLANVHVPLLFYGPSLLQPQRYNRVCSQVDVLPTIAGIVKQPVVNTALGRDLLHTPADKAFAFVFDPDYRKIGLVCNGYYYRREMNSGKEVILPAVLPEQLAQYPAPDTSTLRSLTEAIYQTAGYLMLNNRKKKPQ